MMRAKAPIACFVAAIATHVLAQSAPMPQGPAPSRPPELTSRSVLFDIKAADAQRARRQPQYIESIIVEGRDPDAARGPRKPLEQRFAEVLLRPSPAPAKGGRMFDTTPCMSVQSTWNNIGNSYAPLIGCP